MSRATEITTSRRGDVTNARDKQTVLCPLLIPAVAVSLKCPWFYCLLRSYKITFQLCGLSEHIDVAFITNQNGYDSLASAMYFERFWFRRCTRSSKRLSCEYYITGKNNKKNTHKNPKFERVRQVPIRELGWEFPDWDLSHFKSVIFFLSIYSVPSICITCYWDA